ncbi:succinate dehydrogenase, cytochrome b556 subunit [Candidatus Spongiihabitans sp.]|uniref:succinate dehydrogenase, cytochrome b556 subunit n=1 Tax=Candidatus Spongiihabitans sp. TaxID=3101308 RepID=UPI003C7BC458
MPTNQRPLSPHLQVYKPQLTSVLSILHRASGVAITFGAMIIVWWLWRIAAGADNFNAAFQFLNSLSGKGLLVVWTLCTSYHLLNGIRHLCWDFGYGFELDQVYLSGKVVLAGSALLTILVWLI